MIFCFSFTQDEFYMIIDLHCHSHFSDGTLAPAVLIHRAQASGVECLALTDHDTLDGLEQFQRMKDHCPIHLISGIELSVCWKKYVIHILGLNIRADAPNLLALTALQNQHRVRRGQQIGQALEKVGVRLAYQKACDLAGHERVGRLHFAQILIQEGVVHDIKSAFKRFLAEPGPAYVAPVWENLENIVAHIVQAGGQAVIAHPLKYGLTRTKLFELISSFKMAGGSGIEVVSGNMTFQDVNEAAAISQRFDLLASSGSDFHDDQASRVALGQQQQLPIHCVPVWRAWT